MKMIKAILRPEGVDATADGLEEAGFVSLTKISAFGRGKQKGVQIGSVRYDELPKTLVLLVVEDDQVDKALEVIQREAHTGNFGDGKVFVVPVERALTIRTNDETL